jgi:hypothetical protein
VRAVLPAALVNFVASASGGGSLFSGNDSDDHVGAMLFLHERTAPGGEKRLVAVRLLAGFTFKHGNAAGPYEEIVAVDKRRRLQAATFSVAGAEGADPVQKDERTVQLLLPDSKDHVVAKLDHSRETGAPGEPPAVATLDYGNRLRFFAGQADPADASHFTIPYQLDGRDGTIDGWLKDEGVLLQPRSGTMSVGDLEPAWELEVPPTTVPTKPPD